MSLTTGLVLSERSYIGDVTPPAALEDMSRFGNDGVHTAITMAQLPSGLWVMTFNGTSSIIECGGDESLSVGLSDFTSVCWFNSAVDTTHVIMHTSLGNNFQPLYLAVTTGRIRLGLGGTSFSPASPSNNLTGTWRHLACSVDRDGDVTFVVQGVVEDEVDISGQVAVNVVITTFDFSWNQAANRINGQISLPRLYTRALSAQEIADLFEEERTWFGV